MSFLFSRFGKKKPKAKFSLENLKYLHAELQLCTSVGPHNADKVIEVIRNIAEVMIWGDQNDEQSFFDFFCEKSILANFRDILKQKCSSNVRIQVIQSLSILIANTTREISVFYLLSNNYINDLIVSNFDFANEDILAYYISFLKKLSLRLNLRTIHFFFNEAAGDFPLYTEAIKFFAHGEGMVRTAVRSITLNIFRVDYAPLREFLFAKSPVPYINSLVHFTKVQHATMADAVL